MHEGRRALVERDDGIVGPDRQPVAVALDERDHVQPIPVTPRDEMTGIDAGGACVSGSSAISRSVASRSPARASCVTTCSVAPPLPCCWTRRAIEAAWLRSPPAILASK